MADTGKIAKNLERFAQAVAAHDRENPTHTAYGIGLAHFDMERLGFEEGEEILPGITIHADSGVTGNFRVLCDGQHDEERDGGRGGGVEAVATRGAPGRRSPGAVSRWPSASASASVQRARRDAGARGDHRHEPLDRRAVASRGARRRAAPRPGSRPARAGARRRCRAASSCRAWRARAELAERIAGRVAAPSARPTAQPSSIAPTSSARSSGVERISPSSLS